MATSCRVTWGRMRDSQESEKGVGEHVPDPFLGFLQEK